MSIVDELGGPNDPYNQNFLKILNTDSLNNVKVIDWLTQVRQVLILKHSDLDHYVDHAALAIMYKDRCLPELAADRLILERKTHKDWKGSAIKTESIRDTSSTVVPKLGQLELF